MWENGGQLSRGEEEDSHADYDADEYCGEDPEGVYLQGRTGSDEQLEDGPEVCPGGYAPHNRQPPARARMESDPYLLLPRP